MIEPIEDIEYMSRASIYCEDNRIQNYFVLFLDSFPDRLKLEKNYFQILKKIFALKKKSIEIETSFIEERRKRKGIHSSNEKREIKELEDIKNSKINEINKNLENLQKIMEANVFEKAEYPLRDYLILHFLMNNSFSVRQQTKDFSTSDDRFYKNCLLSITPADIPGKDNYQNQLMTKLEEDNYASVFSLAANISDEYADRIDLYDKGSSHGDLISKLKMSEMLLSSLLFNLIKEDMRLDLVLNSEFFSNSYSKHSFTSFRKGMDAVKNKVANVIATGIEKNMPLAIAITSSFIDRVLEYSSLLFDPKVEDAKKAKIINLVETALFFVTRLDLKDDKLKNSLLLILNSQSQSQSQSQLNKENYPKIMKQAKQDLKVGITKKYEWIEENAKRKLKTKKWMKDDNKIKNLLTIIHKLEDYILHASLREASQKDSSISWMYVLYNPRLKNINFARNLKNTLEQIYFGDPKEHPVKLEKLRNQFLSKTSSSELNRALQFGVQELYYDLPAGRHKNK